MSTLKTTCGLCRRPVSAREDARASETAKSRALQKALEDHLDRAHR